MAHAHTEKALALLRRTGHPDAAADKAMIRKAIGEHDKQLHHGEHTKLHLARGGAAKHGKGTHVNVIVAPQGGGMGGPPRPVPVPVPAAGGAPAAGPPPGMGGPPMGRPMMPPGGGMPPGGPGMRPPGMKRGGGVKKRADGGSTEGPDNNLRDDKGWMDRGLKASRTPGVDSSARARGGAATSEANAIKPRRKDTPTANKDEYLEHTEAKRGGAIKRMKGGMVPMNAGAGGAKGRLEKIKAYGARPR
jgi:hypothetical protein